MKLASLVMFRNSGFFRTLTTGLQTENRELYYRLYRRWLRTQKSKQVYVPTYRPQVLTWNGRFIDKITDLPLRRLLYHVTHIREDADIAFAISLYSDPSHQRIFSHVGYMLFLGESDAKVAKRFKFRLGQVRAVRELFFDFSATPDDPIARTAYFKQLTDNKMIEDVDRRYYKALGAIGDLVLRVEADPLGLDLGERERLQGYLAGTLLENATTLHMTIENKKDMLAYNATVTGIASLSIKGEELNFLRARTDNLKANTARILNERTDYGAGQDAEDEKALALLKEASLYDAPPPGYKTITELLDTPES